MTSVAAIYRDTCFSPNSVEKDKAILDAAAMVLESRGMRLEYINEGSLAHGMQADVFLSMGRSSAALAVLKEKERGGAVVINTPSAVENCVRSVADRLMRTGGIPVAPLSGTDGYWIKRGDGAAQCGHDVCYAAGEDEKKQAVERMLCRGIGDVVVTAHVKGDLVKFYGVRGTEFFRYFYPTDDGKWKFDNERINGRAHHYRFSEYSLRRDAERVAELTGAEIYGGDCVVRHDGSYAIIDFNDFPSFSRCRNEAAEAIAMLVCKRAAMQGKGGME